MSCERVQALMGVSAELDRAERLLLSQHLRDCAACRVAMLDEERVRAYLAGLPELPVPGRLLAGLMAIPTVAQTQPTAALGRWLLVLGLMATALLGLAGRLLDHPRSRATAPAVTLPAIDRPRPAASVAAGSASAAADGPPATAQASEGNAAGMDPPAGRTPTARPLRPSGPGGSRSRPAAPDSMDGFGAPDAASSVAAPVAASPPDASSPAVPRDRPADPPPAATLAPLPSSTPPTCIAVTFEAFLDLAGDGGRACLGCDGRFDEADVAAATAAGLTLPGAAVYWIDATGENGTEAIRMTGEGAIARSESQLLCGTMPITVGLSIGLPEAFDFCPFTPGRRTVTIQDGGGIIRWAIGRPECPAATATPPGGLLETPAASEPTNAPSAASPEPQSDEPPPLRATATPGPSITPVPIAPPAPAGARPDPSSSLQAWYPSRT